MEIIPAIDIRQGKCVRLYQGDYNQQTVYSDDPADIALRWQSQGAPRIHIVDLDGAAEGKLVNLQVIKDIAESVQVPTQLGGGIRHMSVIEELLKAGIERVILGTAAVEDPELVREACTRFGEAIIVSIDTLEGQVATHGWRKDSGLSTIEFARSMIKLGVRRFIFTDISRDGTLTEPNFAAFSELVNVIKLPMIASGGVTNLNHIRMLQQLGAEGVIIGKALYTGDINLKEALAMLAREEAKG